MLRFPRCKHWMLPSNAKVGKRREYQTPRRSPVIGRPTGIKSARELSAASLKCVVAILTCQATRPCPAGLRSSSTLTGMPRFLLGYQVSLFREPRLFLALLAIGTVISVAIVLVTFSPSVALARSANSHWSSGSQQQKVWRFLPLLPKRDWSQVLIVMPGPFLVKRPGGSRQSEGYLIPSGRASATVLTTGGHHVSSRAVLRPLV